MAPDAEPRIGTVKSDANRVIVLTPPGPAAIAVVRITGPAVSSFLGRYFSRPTPIGRCVHGLLTDSARHTLDDPIVLLISPCCADLNLHGGSWVVRSVIELLKANGFEILSTCATDPLPREALDSEEIIEQEVEAYLPLARTELAIRTLLAQPAAWQKLQDDPNPDAVRRVINDPALLYLLHPPRVAIVGLPNVGKSTLANQLFAQDRSIVADLPGTTRDWVGELANIDGLPVLLVDTPGLHDTPDPIERVAIQRSANQIQQASLILFVLDATRPFEGPQIQLLSQFPQAMVVINKVDAAMATGMMEQKGIRISATTGEGLAQLRLAICRHFNCHQLDPAVPRWWTSRQRAWLMTHLADEG